MNRGAWSLEEVDGSPWRLEEVDGGDEQYPVESRFAVRHTPPDEQDPRFDRRRSVWSVLWYATHLPINRTPVSTVGGLIKKGYNLSPILVGYQDLFLAPLPGSNSVG